MPSILVAGATGYLGRHVVQAAAARGWNVTALVRGDKSVDGATQVVSVDVTDPSTLQGVADGHDFVFSALGITRQTDKVTYEDIEYTANVHLLDEALRAGVVGFGVISVVRPDVFADLAICVSREKFVRHLQQSASTTKTLPTVVRATGFFSDLQDVFDMAAGGRLFLVGDGETQVNPVHGEDLANAALDALVSGVAEVDVGGPDVMSWNAIARLAFSSLQTPPKVTHVPVWFAKAALAVVRLVHRRAFDVGSFIARGSTNDVVAPTTGRHTLASHYQELARGRTS